MLIKQLKDLISDIWLKKSSRRNITFLCKVQNSKGGIHGRPVNSSVNCHTSKISEYVDYHVQPMVLEIFSYIKEASDFLRKLKPITEFPENSRNSWCKIILQKHPKFRRDKSSKNIPWKLYEENNSQKGKSTLYKSNVVE